MSSIKDLNSLSQIIKDEINKVENHINTASVGQVVSVGDCIATVYGLDEAMYGELIVFPGPSYGMVMNIEENNIGVALFGDDISIKEGDLCQRTGEVVSVPVGDSLLGRVVNALGQPIDGKGKINATESRPVEMPAPSIMDRESVCEPLETGIKVIDAMIPIGKGQRELIIGDRQTGKTAIAIDTIINQKNKDVICIYCAIGQKNSSLTQIVNKLKQFDALKYTVVVSANASQSSPMLYLAPYAATSIGEYWMRQGKNVLIIYDDLSKHAVAYRTLLLLLRRSPGREAYPGDIFYLHSRLLERSCRLTDELGGGSITSLPIVETQAGDISAYIPTNIISITDGQLFLNTDMFNAGQRPAIDSSLSVSRVGSAAQTKIMKKESKNLRMELANYHEMLDFSRFGSDLDKATQKILTHGAVLLEVLKQKQYMPLSMSQEIIDIFVVQSGSLDDINPAKVHSILKLLSNYIMTHNIDIYKNIAINKTFSDEDKKTVLSILKDIKDAKINDALVTED
ncbi:MAG: F0F1 ATP synthase subunit alpha [Mollicutes bacterium]|nr:F0F1 ATP synthase subunit alpha [Mollicutes bacterium]MDD7264223.1 F0F1 ATP synthase subunit alpha [bacterium]MDY4979334.1 F0F1 ATP synthase subunit alpha [Candidatus Onthovivens sp.]